MTLTKTNKFLLAAGAIAAIVAYTIHSKKKKLDTDNENHVGNDTDNLGFKNLDTSSVDQ